MRYERLVNPISIPDGPTAKIPGYLDHFPFSKGLEHWVTRHNSYSNLEAKQIIENRRGQASFSLVKAVACTDFHQRRFHQKEIFYRLPMRPLVKFLVLYVGKRGFLDGKAGFTYAALQSIYEYFIVLKTHQLEKQKTSKPSRQDSAISKDQISASN
ncbi:hypothetical protein [Cupriavidus basilensis]|uniref:hypothetical protein n=1 Tax=Cupriavidus basilensis TaxID=68895 RepID=UPI0039F70700